MIERKATLPDQAKRQFRTAPIASAKVGLPNAWSWRSKGPGGAAGGRSETPTEMVTVEYRVKRDQPEQEREAGTRIGRTNQDCRDDEADSYPGQIRDSLEGPERISSHDDDGSDLKQRKSREGRRREQPFTDGLVEMKRLSYEQG